MVNIPLSRSMKKSESKEEIELVPGSLAITETEEKILLEIRNNPNISLLEISNRLKLSYMTVQKYSAKLREKGFIERVGSKRCGYWRVIEK